ncbi:hypothetical protein EON67_01165 [archaeon]|nr:MAG: hypothetical protein EON67_01165 [archaeon]
MQNLERVGVENPVREELYRAEQVENRIGKTRMKGKVRPPTPKFLQRMRLEDEQEALLDQVDWFYAEDVLPDQEIVDDLLDGLNEVRVEGVDDGVRRGVHQCVHRGVCRGVSAKGA